ncbi:MULTISPECIES: endonuclease III [Candidatus Ichthyocystis]|uniref:endonuclease III n=1 Tax=Candidatus Ichthyocystis TaxID=2929841 RepID=UPI000A659DD7|nr:MULTISPECIES: endonuclease III [Ichthyocystis]
MSDEERAEIFERFKKDRPEPTTELVYEGGYQLLVAVILSAQATDKSVNNVTANLFKVAPSPHSMVAMGKEKLSEFIRTVGLYRNKASNIIRASEKLIKDHGGDVPSSYDELVALPGVGRKTAQVVLNTLFNHPVIAVDTHVFRVSNRTGIASSKNVADMDKKINKAVPIKYKKYAHHWLILHGRYTCRSQKPLCGRCIIMDLCEYQNKNLD